MKEINCLTHQRSSDFRPQAKESLYPITTFRTDSVRVDEGMGKALTFDPDVIIEVRQHVDLKTLIKGGEDFLRDGFSYDKWIDKDGQVRHWHIEMNPYFDHETYKFFRSIADSFDSKKRAEYIEHVNAHLPVFQLLHTEGMIYDFKDGRQLLGQGDAVLMRHVDGIPRTTRDYRGKAIQTVLRTDVFVPRGGKITPEDVEILAGVRFSQIDLFGVDKEIDSKMKDGNIREDFVRGIINPYFYVER